MRVNVSTRLLAATNAQWTQGRLNHIASLDSLAAPRPMFAGSSAEWPHICVRCIEVSLTAIIIQLLFSPVKVLKGI